MNEEPNKTGPSPHPPGCQACRGTGWMPGPPRYLTIAGRPNRYDTVQRCTHDWWHDEHRWEEPLPADHPRALAAYERGLAEGRAELAEMRGDSPQPTPRQEELAL